VTSVNPQGTFQSNTQNLQVSINEYLQIFQIITASSCVTKLISEN